ncbi:unnamed protein product, partial [marine sediment metagenome]
DIASNIRRENAKNVGRGKGEVAMSVDGLLQVVIDIEEDIVKGLETMSPETSNMRHTSKRLSESINILSQEPEREPIVPRKPVGPKAPRGVKVELDKIQEEVSGQVRRVLDRIMKWEGNKEELDEKRHGLEEELEEASRDLKDRIKEVQDKEREALKEQLAMLTKVRDLYIESLEQFDETDAIVERFRDGALVIQRTVQEEVIEPEELAVLKFQVESLKRLHPRIAKKIDEMGAKFIKGHTSLERQIRDIAQIVMRKEPVKESQ